MALFFTRFNFTLSYRPGSRNVKPDALSRQFQREDYGASAPDTILPSPCVVASLTWEIEERVRAATEGQPGPSACPTGCLSVSAALRLDGLQWAHGSRLTCHPGIQRTLDVLLQLFWCPSYRRTAGSMSEPAKPATRTYHLAKPHPASCSLFQCHIAPGPTFKWTL